VPASSEAGSPTPADTAAAPDTAEVAVELPAHLHARPAGQVVRVAAGFSASVQIGYGARSANARGVLGLLSLGATAGTTVVVRASGPDAQAAADAVAAVLATAE
jgi:phosphotransferase system HPr (HPr) family protein